MNRQKVILISVVSVAVVAAAVSAVMVNVNRAAAARAYAEAAASEEAAAEAEAKTAAKQTEAEAEKRRAAEANAKAKADELKAAELNRKAAEDNRKEAEAKAKAAESERATARAKAEAAKSESETARAKAKTAKDEKAKAEAEATAASEKAKEAERQLALEKLHSEKILAEAKALELRKIDFNEWQSELIAIKLDLDERERALTPEKTITDLAWAGGVEDSVMDENGNIKKEVKEPYLAEKDLTLPRESRSLAKTERLLNEAQAEASKRTRQVVVGTLERLYEMALREDRVVDADFYRQSLKSLYPDWEFKPSTDTAN